MMGCPMDVAALSGCRWILLYLSVCASFEVGRWSAKACQPYKFPPLWPASWVAAFDKSRTSSSVEVRDTWRLYDERFAVLCSFVMLWLLITFWMLESPWSLAGMVWRC